MAQRPPKVSPYHGFVIIDKPLHMTSSDVVVKARRILKMKKIGHAGTLDPLASGVLPLALGEGTKCIHLMMDAKKRYRFRIRFGEARSTDDAEGEVINISTERPTNESIGITIKQFIGDIAQVPPIYSALKVHGRRAYELARAGAVVELAPRQVQVHDLKLISMISADEAEFVAEVGKGTYIRSLARDIAQALGTCGYISYLRRESVGVFDEARAISLDFLEKHVHKATAASLSEWLQPLSSLLDGIPACEVTEVELKQLRCGQAIDRTLPPGDLLAITFQGSLVAFGVSNGINVQPKRVLNINPDVDKKDAL